nr:transposase, MuDR [Tanacetum cinerariifolium]
MVRASENELNLFTLKVNHGGVFTYVYGPKRIRAPKRVYKGGNVDWFDDVDADGFSVLEVPCMVKGVSYVNKYKLMEVFIEHPLDNSVMDTINLEQEDASAGLGDENVHAIKLTLSGGLDNVEEFDPMFFYLYMQTDNNERSDHNEGSDNNEGSNHNEGSDYNEGSDNNEVSDDNNESDDINFECDIEDRIDDVHVDMQMFKDNIDPNEVDIEDFDSEIDSNDDEAERRKALRKLGKCHKPVDGNTYTENFYVTLLMLLATKGFEVIARHRGLEIVVCNSISVNYGVTRFVIVREVTKRTCSECNDAFPGRYVSQSLSMTIMVAWFREMASELCAGLRDL